MLKYIEPFIETGIYFISCFIIFVIGKFLYQLLHRKINVREELVEKDNFAFALSQVGYYIGLLLAVGSSIVGESHGLWIDLMDIGIYGILAIVLLNLSLFINDKIILHKFSTHKEIIEDRNAGTGIIEAASSISCGLIIYGAVSGEASDLTSNLISAIAFWAIGQLILIATAYIYNFITPYDIHKHIEKDNVAVGIGFAGALISIANIIRFALMGDLISWNITLSNIGIDILLGLILLPIIRFLTDKLLLPGEKLTDEIVNQEKPNIGAALIEAFAYIGGSILITWCL